LDAGIAAQIVRERGCRPRLELAGDQPVLRPQPGTRDRRRAGIDREAAALVERADDVEIGLKKRRDLGWQGRRQQSLDAVVPFAAASGFRSGEIVKPEAGMAVDDA